jgi:hypothetical protein
VADWIEKIPECLCSNAGLPGSFTNALSIAEQIQWLLNAYNQLFNLIDDKTSADGGNNVKYIQQNLTNEQIEQVYRNLNIPNDIKNTVLFTKQTLTNEQAGQARENIGAYDLQDILKKFISFTVYQTLTDGQLEVVYNNIKLINAINKRLQEYIGGSETYTNLLTINETFIDKNNSYLHIDRIRNLIITSGYLTIKENITKDNTVLLVTGNPNILRAKKQTGNNEVWISPQMSILQRKELNANDLIYVNFIQEVEYYA